MRLVRTVIFSFLSGESLQGDSTAGPVPNRSEEDRRARAAQGVKSKFYYKRDGVTVKPSIVEVCVLLKLISCGFKLCQVIGFDPIGGVIKDFFLCLCGGRMTEEMLKFEQEHNG